MATHHGFQLPGRSALSRPIVVLPASPSRRLRVALAAGLCALLFAAPAQAKKKHSEPEPAPAPATTASTPPPPSSTSSSSSSSSSSEESESSGPALTIVGLALDAQGTQAAALAQYLAEQAAHRAGKQSVLTLEAALDPDGAKAREKAAHDGDRALNAAKKAYFNDLDLDTSGALCDKAVQNYLKSDLPAHFNRLVEAMEMKIACFAADPKQSDKVRAELGQLLPIDPRTELSPNLFNPDVIKLAEGIRSTLRDASNLTLQVKTGTVSARVFVDGSFRGISPTTVKNLAPGSHLVTVVAPGFERLQQKVNPSSDPVLDAKLNPVGDAAALGPKLDAVKKTYRSDQLQKSLAALGSALKAEQVLLMASGAGPTPGSREVSAVRVTVTPAALSTDLDAPLPSDAAKAAQAIDALATQACTSEHLLKGHRAPVDGSEGGSGGGGGMRYAGYGLIGGGAVAAGVGTYFGLTAKSQESNFKTLPQTSPSAGSVANSGKTDALIANVAFGTAVVAAGVGVALAVMGGGHSSPDASVEEASAPAKPAEKPVATKPADKPASKPADSRPASASKPASSTATASKPADTKPAESKPASSSSSKPADAKPADTAKPASSSKPAETKPAEAEKPKPEPAPDAGAPATTTKPPASLGDDIKD
ncbi:MAG: PEGA domain-containing protein [Deltaproteobacteria bacterium]|nr:PEGA domain-containing protein [Deltaproteobacteria bacterium]